MGVGESLSLSATLFSIQGELLERASPSVGLARQILGVTMETGKPLRLVVH
jgi:hypothetical protein